MTTQLKIEAGKKYRTRGGDEVEVLRTDLQSDQPVLGVITTSNEGCSLFEKRPFEQCAGMWTSRGRWVCTTVDEDWTDNMDIISEIKPKRVVWLNVYDGGSTGYGHTTREAADETCTAIGRIARVRVEF